MDRAQWTYEAACTDAETVYLKARKIALAEFDRRRDNARREEKLRAQDS